MVKGPHNRTRPRTEFKRRFMVKVDRHVRILLVLEEQLRDEAPKDEAELRVFIGCTIAEMSMPTITALWSRCHEARRHV